MELRLERLQILPSCTLGSLFIDGVWECFTKEAAARSDNVFVGGESALPIGLYTVSLTHSKRFGRIVPLLVSSRLVAHGGKRLAMGARILPGHHMVDAEAGILVGQTQGPANVHQTRLAYEALFDKLELIVRGGEAIDAEITQPLG